MCIIGEHSIADYTDDENASLPGQAACATTAPPGTLWNMSDGRPAGYATSAELAILSSQAGAVLQLGREFPEQVLQHPLGSLRWTDVEYRGWAPIRDFARVHHDTEVNLLVPRYAPGSLRSTTGQPRAGFTISADASTEAFEALRTADTGVAFGDTWVMFGPSGRWGMFGERDLAAWWSNLPDDDPELSAWELRYRPWAYSITGAAELWSLAFTDLEVPIELLEELQRNYGGFDRPDREAAMPEVPINERSFHDLE